MAAWIALETTALEMGTPARSHVSSSGDSKRSVFRELSQVDLMQVRRDVNTPPFQARHTPDTLSNDDQSYVGSGAFLGGANIQGTSRAGQSKLLALVIHVCQHCGRFDKVCDEDSGRISSSRTHNRK